MAEVTKIPLANTKQGYISVTTIDEPYGAGTESVASIAISLNGEDIEWKVHIPMANLDEVITSLQNLK
jgi:hypothetical protein